MCVRADEDGLQRVLINLVVNAAEASPPGRTVRVDVAAAADAEVEMRVLDDGPGLSESIRDRVFDPFFTTKQHGTGLGLTIAHRLIEAYGGRLTVRGTGRPAGRSFWSCCRRSERQRGGRVRGGTTTVQRRVGQGGPMACICVIDDQAMMRDSLEATLAAQEHKVFAVRERARRRSR